MKFIFDNEEQKDTFMKAFSEKFDECPGLLGLNELSMSTGETNTKVELMSREKWLAERIIALLEVIKFNVDHSIIISDKWVDELNSVSYDFNECIKEKENE